MDVSKLNPFSNQAAATDQNPSQSEPQSHPQSQPQSQSQSQGGQSQNHTEDQKRQFYESLPAEEKQNKSYTQWVQEAYTEQYEKWMPWLEEQYLKWFGGGENKASYGAKGISLFFHVNLVELLF